MTGVAAVGFGQTRTQGSEKDSGFVVREWHVDDGLPQEDVFRIFQDSKGFLWIACRGVLSRFDGSAFQTYEAVEAQQTFYGIVEDEDGSLLLAPRSGDPVRFRNGTFTKEPLPAPYTGLAIGYLAGAPDGARWFSFKGGVLRLKGSDVEVFDAKDGVTDQGWSRFATDGENRFWVCTDDRLFRYDKGRLVPVTLPADASELRVASSREGGPWLITPTRVMKRSGDDRWENVADLPPLLGSRYINACLEDKKGNLWLGTRSLGIHVVAGGELTHVQTLSETIQTLLQDRDGTIWAGANTGGLSAVTPKIHTLYNKELGLTTIAVLSVCEDIDGAIWVANGDGGVARIRETQVDKWTLSHDARVYGARAVTPHPEGGVWAVGSSTLFRIRGDSDRTEVVSSVNEGVHPILLTAANGDLWFTTTDRRIGRLRDGRCEYFGPAEGVDPAGVRSFCELPSGVVLVGTNGGQLLKLVGGRFVGVFEKDAVLSSAINVIVPLKDSYLLATAAEGLAIVSQSEVKVIGRRAGLPGDNVTQLVPDGRGSLWCGSGQGVFRVSLADLQRIARNESRSIPLIQLGKDDGLRTITCVSIYGPGAVKSRAGRIWFASRQGVLAINPEAEALAPRPPVVTIEQVRVRMKEALSSLSDQSDASSHKVMITFSVLSLVAPGRVSTRHRLIGFDSEWVESGSAREAVYPHLAPGKYRFEIVSGFGDSAVAESRAVVDIVVPRQWWQARWFQGGVLTLVIGSVVLLVRAWSHRRLRLKVERLERENAVATERARIARNIHDDVGASLTRISLLTQATSSQSTHASQLNRIYETAAEITRSLDEIVWAIDPQDDTLESFVSYLTDFAQKFLDLAGVRCRLQIPPAVPATALSSEVRHDLFLCCRELLNNLVKHAAASEAVISLEFDPPKLRIVIEDNGRGIPPLGEKSSQADRVSTGHGVKNVAQRIERHGGTLVIETPASGGTRVVLNVTTG